MHQGGPPRPAAGTGPRDRDRTPNGAAMPLRLAGLNPEPCGDPGIQRQYLRRWFMEPVGEATADPGLVSPTDLSLYLSKQVRIHPLQVRLKLPALAAVIAKLVCQREHAEALPELTPLDEVVLILRLLLRPVTQSAQLLCEPTGRPQRRPISNDRPVHPESIEVPDVRAKAGIPIDADHRDIGSLRIRQPDAARPAPPARQRPDFRRALAQDHSRSKKQATHMRGLQQAQLPEHLTSAKVTETRPTHLRSRRPRRDPHDALQISRLLNGNQVSAMRDDHVLARPAHPTNQPPLHRRLQIHRRLVQHRDMPRLALQEHAQYQGFLHSRPRQLHKPLTMNTSHRGFNDHPWLAVILGHGPRPHIQVAAGQLLECGPDLLETLPLTGVTILQPVQLHTDSGPVPQIRRLAQLLKSEAPLQRQPPVISQHYPALQHRRQHLIKPETPVARVNPERRPQFSQALREIAGPPADGERDGLASPLQRHPEIHRRVILLAGLQPVIQTEGTTHLQRELGSPGPELVIPVTSQYRMPPVPHVRELPCREPRPGAARVVVDHKGPRPQRRQRLPRQPRPHRRVKLLCRWSARYSSRHGGCREASTHKRPDQVLLPLLVQLYAQPNSERTSTLIASVLIQIQPLRRRIAPRTPDHGTHTVQAPPQIRLTSSIRPSNHSQPRTNLHPHPPTKRQKPLNLNPPKQHSCPPPRLPHSSECIKPRVWWGLARLQRIPASRTPRTARAIHRRARANAAPVRALERPERACGSCCHS